MPADVSYAIGTEVEYVDEETCFNTKSTKQNTKGTKQIESGGSNLKNMCAFCVLLCAFCVPLPLNQLSCRTLLVRQPKHRSEQPTTFATPLSSIRRPASFQ